jgi:hypothetical protein
MATERASLRSVLSELPVPNTRTLAAKLGGTSSTVSPAATSCWATSKPRPPAASTAQVRSSNRSAQPRSRWAWAGVARTEVAANTASVSSTATAAWVALWGSIPIITLIAESFQLEGKGRSGHA